MPGAAKTKSFMLSTATVMIGPQDQLMKLNPADHSIGLVKNFQMTNDPTFVELTQGIKNTVVMSVKNGEGIKCSFEAYEYTLRNLAYGAGFDASGVAYNPMDTIWVTAASVTSNNAVLVLADVTSQLVPGDYVYLQNGVDDSVHIAKVATVGYNSPNSAVTFAAGYETKTGSVWPAGCRMGEVKRVDLGTTQQQAEMCAKIVGLLPKDNAPFTIFIPRMKITKGMGLAFQTDNFGNLPWEITPYNGISSDPFYSEFGDAVAVLFAR